MASLASSSLCSRASSHYSASTSASTRLNAGCNQAANVTMNRRRTRHFTIVRSVDQDLDWEPSPGPLKTPKNSRIPPPPPKPPTKPTAWWEAPFTSRRNIALTMLAGSAGLWLLNNKAGPIRFAEKPDIPFKLLGFTDLDAEDFVYFKTQGGNWLAAAEDEMGRMFMIDEIGDLYYDSGDPDIGMYVMDTEGNLFNFYNDIGGERKITPVGNISDLKSFKISELAGVKLDRDINVVAFQDGRQIPLPPGTGYVDENGKFVPPGELVEGYTRSRSEPGNFLTDLIKGPDPMNAPPDRFELDLNDPTPFQKQMFDQVLLDDPTIPGWQPALPDDFDIDEFAAEVEEEERRTSRRSLFGFGRRRAPVRRGDEE